MQLRSLPWRLAACYALALPLLASPASATSPVAGALPAPIDNAALVREAFEAWRTGRGSVFDLLDEDVEWTVAGHSPVSGTYRSRAAFMEQAVAPITARLATPIVPTVEHVVAQDDTVVVLWSGEATARDGQTYRNRYAWHLQLREGRIVRVVAFLDTWALAELMR
jgi:Ketosteroid isomerase-related protein